MRAPPARPGLCRCVISRLVRRGRLPLTEDGLGNRLSSHLPPRPASNGDWRWMYESRAVTGRPGRTGAEPSARFTAQLERPGLRATLERSSSSEGSLEQTA